MNFMNFVMRSYENSTTYFRPYFSSELWQIIGVLTKSEAHIICFRKIENSPATMNQKKKNVSLVQSVSFGTET